MKNDLLNAMIHMSLNEPPIHDKEADSFLNKVMDIYVSESHYKVLKLYSEKSVSAITSRKAGSIEVLSNYL